MIVVYKLSGTGNIDTCSNKVYVTYQGFIRFYNSVFWRANLIRQYGTVLIHLWVGLSIILY